MRLTPVLLAFLSAAPGLIAAEPWSEFRGPNGTGHADARGLPVKFGEKENLRWKTLIHDKGHSSPVLWGDQIWMTTARADGTELFAVCVERRSGKVLHDVKVFGIAKPMFCIPFNSYASPTPAVEEGRVYVHFGSAGTACLDTATGKKVWERQDLPCDHWRGPGSSPILVGDLLILTFDGFDLQYVAALDKQSGKTVWKKDREIAFPKDNGDYKKAYGTPSVFPVGGRPLLISPAAEAVTAYDVRTGEQVWRATCGGMNVATRPLLGHGRLYFTTGAGGLQLFAVRPDGTGDVTKSHIDWTYAKSVPTRPSPLLIGDHLYLISDGGIASCVDARTGKQVQQTRLNGKYSSSPIYADGRIYAFSEEGDGVVLEASPALKVLQVNKLDEGCMASPAAEGKSLFVRTRTHLYCFETP